MSIGRPNLQTVDTPDYEGGCNYSRDLTDLTINESPNAMNVIFGTSVRKREGYKEMYATATAAADVGYSLADFAVSTSDRKLIVHMGASVYKMDNLDGVLDVIRASAPRKTSYNAIVKQNLIQTYDDYSTEMYWNGDVSIMLPLSSSAPGFKHCIEYQGYLLGGNTEDYNLRIYYEDINTMIGGSYTDYFTLTGGQDDAVEGFFLINGRCYAATSSGIFRLSYIGGVAVFEYQQIVSDIGLIPRTLKVVVTEKYGQVAVFLGTDKNMYLFDGSYVRNISKKYHFPNNDTVFALDYIDDGFIKNATSSYDSEQQIYRLFVTVKGQSTNTIAVNIDVETLAYYPFDNMTFASAIVARDNLNKRFLIGADYAGKVHKLFNGEINDNGKVIIEYYESPLLVSRAPHMKKPRSIDLHFKPVANYKLRLSDRTDHDKTWNPRVDLDMFRNRDKFIGQNTSLGELFKLGRENEVLIHSVNLPIMENAYRFRLGTTGADSGDDCSYIVGTVSGTGGGTTLTGTGTYWTSDMTAANGYRIWIDDGNHANTSYTFTATDEDAATVSTMEAGDISGATYMIYKTKCAACSKGWELLKMDYNTQILGIGKTEVMR